MTVQQIRVVRVISRMNVGGPAWQVTALSAGLCAEGFSTELLVGSVDADEEDFLSLRGGDVKPLRIRGLGRRVTFLGDLRAFVEIVTVIRRVRPEIVHTHTTKAGVLGRLAAWLCRTPVIVHTFHGHLLTGYFPPWKVKLLVFTERLLGRLSTALVAVGSQVRDDLREHRVGVESRFEVIAPGVAEVEPMSSARFRQEFNIPDDSPTLLFVGRLVPIKRPDRLISAHRQVLMSFPKAILVIVGDGELRGESEDWSADIQSQVRFVGWRDDAPALMGGADVVVLASDNEGTPVVLIEAAMAGTAVVCTRVGSTAEVVDHGVTGLICDVSDDSLAESICRLLADHELRASMGRRARDRARLLFGTDRLIRDHRILYRRLLGHD